MANGALLALLLMLMDVLAPPLAPPFHDVDEVQALLFGVLETVACSTFGRQQEPQPSTPALQLPRPSWLPHGTGSLVATAKGRHAEGTAHLLPTLDSFCSVYVPIAVRGG